MLLLFFFINKITSLPQFAEFFFQKNSFKSNCLMYKSFFALKYYQNFIIQYLGEYNMVWK